MLLIQGNSCHPWRYSASLFHYGNASLRPHLPGFLLQMKVTQREFVTTHLLRQSKPCCKSGKAAWGGSDKHKADRTPPSKNPHVTVCASSSCSWMSWQQAGSLGEWCDSCRAFSGNTLQQDTNYRSWYCPGCRQGMTAVYKGEVTTTEIRQNAAGPRKEIYIFISHLSLLF